MISWLVSLIRDAQSKKQEHKPRTHQTLAASLKATGGLGVVTVLLIARCTTWHTPKSRVRIAEHCGVGVARWGLGGG